MEKSKTPPDKLLSALLSVSLAVCLVALIHVEIELHAHRQTLKVLNQEREDNIELRSIVHRHEEKIDFVLKTLQSGSPEGNCE